MARTSRSAMRTVALGLCTVLAGPLTAQSVVKWQAVLEFRLAAEEHDFTRISSIAVSHDGSLVVWQPQDGRILFFDPRGAPAGSIGRRGEGPGEFRTFGLHGWIGDSLWVYDQGTHRVTLISPEHRILRSWSTATSIRLTAHDTATRFSRPFPVALVGAGDLLTAITVRPGGPRPPWYPEAENRRAYVIADSSGVIRKFVTWGTPWFGDPCMKRFPGGELGIPFCATIVQTVSADGLGIVSVNQHNIAGAGGVYRVTAVTMAGDTAFSREYSYRPIPIPRAVSDSYIAVRATPAARYPPEAIAAYRAMTLPPTFAPIRRAIMGRDRTVWLELETRSAAHTWQVLNPRGDPIAQVTVPASVEMVVANRTAIWGIETDADGLQSVVRFRVIP